MSDFGEAIGTAAEGGLFARAIGKKPGSDGAQGGKLVKGHFAEDTCLNCGTVLQGAHCHTCGQKAHLHRTLGAFGRDILHGALHFDGKTWRTLPMLAFKPGQLTRRYIDGERVRFVSPMALFLFGVFLMFAVFQAIGISTPTDLEGDTRAVVAQLAEDEANSIAAKIAEIDEELAEPDLDAARRVALETDRLTLERDRTLLKERGANLTHFLTTGDTEFLDDLATQGEARIAEAKERLDTLPEGSREHADLTAEIAGAEKGMSQLRNFTDQTQTAVPFVDTSDTVSGDFSLTGIKSIDEGIVQKWRENPSLMLYKLQNNFYKFSWLLIPISVPFVWVMFFWKRRFRAYDHAIFVTYSIAFMSLLFLALSVLGKAGVPLAILVVAGVIVPVLHIYKHLKYAYGLSRAGALLRTAVLVFLIVTFVLTIFFLILLLLGAF